jgi:membrane-bound lytic murein transglycosylase B
MGLRWIVAAVVVALLGVAVAQAAVRGTSEDEAAATTPTATAPAALPALDARIPRDARALAADLRTNAARLADAVDEWRASGDLDADRPPDAVTRLATYEARAVALLATRPQLSRTVIGRLPAPLARRVAPEVRALRALDRLHDISHRRPGPPPKIRLGRPEPAATLLDHYRDAQKRFGVGWHVLAAVNYVETKFGRYRNASISGARGPMQFMPATWRAYGLGGDVRDPRDAIMGAANYLRASGAPRSYRRALHAYNPSSLYVNTVRMYANRMASDPRAYLTLYAREVVRPGA